MIRKILLLFLLIVLPEIASAVNVEINGINYYLDTSNNTAEVTRNPDMYSGEVNIPSSVEWEDATYRVTSIGNSAFSNCGDLTSVYIPNSVTSIGECAFLNCTGLTSITIPNSVTIIGESAFSGCSGLTSITIGNSVTSIEYGAFNGCTGLTSITIPNSVTNIGNRAFDWCTGLTSITIPNSVTSIRDETFANCTSLTSITIPNSVTSIGKWAFYACWALTSVTIPNSVTNIEEKAFYASGLASVTIPNSVTSIGDGAFTNCRSLTSVTIGNSVTNIGWYVFSGCSSLASVTIPNSVTSIGECAFYECSVLTSITIPNSVTSIGDGSFGDCIGLTSVIIPNSVTSIGRRVFHNCSSLTSLIVQTGNPVYDSRNNCNAIIHTATNKLLVGCKSSVIPQSVTSIGDEAFYNCTGLTSITIPNSVTNIGGWAFVRCTGLTSMTIGNSVTSIGECAFLNCTGLTSITIPNSVTNIGDSAFENCSGLTSMTIGNSVTNIGGWAFRDCTGLTSITIPNSVTSIGDGAFGDCRGLTSITIGNSVTSIGECAFYGCRGLTSVTIEATEVPTIGGYDDLFYNVNLDKATLYVPIGCIEKYAAVKPWSYFGNIVEGIPSPDDIMMKEAVAYLQEKGVIDKGDADVSGDLLRSHLAKIAFRGLYLLNGRQVPEEVVSDGFPTVYDDIAVKTPSNEYYYQSAKALLYLEYDDGITPFDRNRLKFEPENTILRVNVLKALMETFNIKPDLENSNNPFPEDDDVAKLATNNPRLMGYVRDAQRLGIITKGRPYDKCLRGEAFLMLARIMQKIEAGEIEDPDPQDKDYFQPLNTTLATVGLGVGLQMGNFQHYTKTSFALNGVVPLTFSHTYSSYNTTLPSVFYGARTVDDKEVTYQPLGDGWSHNYHSFITVVAEPAEGDTEQVMKLIVHWGGGKIDVYKAENGKLVPESMGIYDDLSQVGNEVVIKSKSQMEYRFSKQGSTGASVLYLYSIKDRNGNELTINYEDGQNGNKRIKNVTDCHRLLTFDYLEDTDLLEEVKDPLGRSVKFTYFDNDQTDKKQLKTFTDAENNTTTYYYVDQANAGASKLLSRIQLPKGNYIENEYDANRRLSQTVSGVNNVPTSKTSVVVNADYTGSKASTQSTVIVERGTQPSTYHYTYNDNNVVTAMTGAEGKFMNRSYGNDQRPELPTAIQDNSTDVSDISYDPNGNVTSITVSGDGSLTTTMTYDEMNNLTSVKDPMNNTTIYTYDDKGNLVGVLAPEDVKFNMTVDDKGLPTEITNAMGVKTQFMYNDFGNLVKMTLPALGLSSEAAYDDASRLTSTTDALERIRSFEYNKNDYLTSETDAMEHTTSYGYDANDNLITITNAKGGVTTMSYDNATDWLTSVKFAGARKQYDYNEDGTLNSFTKPDGTTLSYSYDELGRMTSDGVNSYSYDNKLRLSSISGNGKKITFSYDGFNRITGTECDNHINSYAYDDNGNCTKVNDVEYDYDGLNRLSSVKFDGKTITYSYRKDSQLEKVSYPNGMNTEFGYDEVGRLTSKLTKLNNGTVVAGYNYTLDKVGNIISQTTKEPYNQMVLADEDVSYTYNEANRITQAGSISFEFDANGNTTKRGSESYIWDVKDCLTEDGSASITYNPLGLIASYGDITFTTDPLGIGNVLSDTRSGAEYIYGNGLEARIKNGKVSYYVTDVRGSVVAIVDESGNITHKYQYDGFGKVTQKEEADYNPFQYVGKYGVMFLNDHLYYMRARHYDPTIGRFLSEDPIWSTNLYPYAENNPIMGIDPRGERMEYYHKASGVTGYIDKDPDNSDIARIYFINKEGKTGWCLDDLAVENEITDVLTKASQMYISEDDEYRYDHHHPIKSFRKYAATLYGEVINPYGYFKVYDQDGNIVKKGKENSIMEKARRVVIDNKERKGCDGNYYKLSVDDGFKPLVVTPWNLGDYRFSSQINVNP